MASGAEQMNISSILKVSAITIVCVLLAIIVFSIFTIHSMKTTSLKPAVNIGIDILKSDMAFFVNKLSYDITATVFARNGNDYRRISTSIVDSAGKRAVDTFLETDKAAYPYIQSGNSYTGNDVILGKNHLAEYRPIFAENRKEVIGILKVE